MTTVRDVIDWLGEVTPETDYSCQTEDLLTELKFPTIVDPGFEFGVSFVDKNQYSYDQFLQTARDSKSPLIIYSRFVFEMVCRKFFSHQKGTITIPNSAKIHPSAVIGKDGFGFTWDDEGVPYQLTHFGGVHIGKRCSIGANTVVDKGYLRETFLCEDVKIDNHVHVAHGVHIGARTCIAAHAMLGGSVWVGEDVWIGPSVSIKEGVEIGDGAYIGIGSNVLTDVPPRAIVAGNPAKILRYRPEGSYGYYL